MFSYSVPFLTKVLSRNLLESGYDGRERARSRNQFLCALPLELALEQSLSAGCSQQPPRQVPELALPIIVGSRQARHMS